MHPWIGSVKTIPMPKAMAPMLPIIAATVDSAKNGQKLIFTVLMLSMEADQKSLFRSTIRKIPNIKKAWAAYTKKIDASWPKTGIIPKITEPIRIAVPQKTKKRKDVRK